MRVFKPVEVWVKQRWAEGTWNASVTMAKWLEPSAIEFYNRLEAEAFRPDHLVRVLPTHGVIYLMVPKAASTRIRTTLGAIGRRYSRRLKPRHWGEVARSAGPAEHRRTLVLPPGDQPDVVSLHVRAQSIRSALVVLGQQISK